MSDYQLMLALAAGRKHCSHSIAGVCGFEITDYHLTRQKRIRTITRKGKLIGWRVFASPERKGREKLQQLELFAAA